MADIIQFRRDTAERWAEFNPTLAEGEIGFVLDTTGSYKVGDGVHAWNDLPLNGFSGNIDISEGWDILDEQGKNLNSALASVGLYILMQGQNPAYYMLVTSDGVGHGITQWIFGNLLINSGGSIQDEYSNGAARIIFRSIRFGGESIRGTWTKWQYFQNDFISNDGNIIKNLPESSVSPSLQFFKNSVENLQDAISVSEEKIKKDYKNLFEETNNNISTVKRDLDELTTHTDNIERTVNLSQGNIDVLKKKTSAITICMAVIPNGTMPPTQGIFLIRNEEGKINEIIVYISPENHKKLTPEIGNIFLCNGVYYGWDGEYFNPLGGDGCVINIGTVEGDGKDLIAYYKAHPSSLSDNHRKIYGDYQLTSYMNDETFAILSKYFDKLILRQPQYTLINSDDTVSDDRNFSNPDNHTGYDYDNDYVMSGHCAKIWNQRFGCLGKQTKEGEMSICKLNPKNFNYYADGTPALLNATQGDAFIYEPNYWYKGINDILGVFSEGRSKKYYAFSSNEQMPDVPNVERLTLEDIQNAGNYRKGYKVKLGLNGDVEGAISTDDNYSLLKVDVSRHKYVRFPTVIGTTVGAVITDVNGNILSEYGISDVDTKIVEGMYIIVKVPEGGETLHFSIKNEAEFGWDDVILSNSDKVEDMETDWVKHEACLIGMFEATEIPGNSGLHSISINERAVNNRSQLQLHNYAAYHKLQLVDWEMSKDVANLFFVRYGRRDVQGQCGHGEASNKRTVGNTDFFGMTDTINRNDATEDAWWIDNEGNVRLTKSVKFGGYENWWGNVAEWMDGVYLSGKVQTIEGKEFESLSYVYQIIMPDGTVRKARSIGIPNVNNFIKYVRHQKYMDVISVGNSNSGTKNTFYSDTQSIADTAAIQAVYRSNNYALASGGVSYVNASYDNNYSSSSVGTRIAFRGTITLVKSASEYKALVKKY